MKINDRIRTFVSRLAVLLLAMILVILTAIPVLAAGTSSKSGTQSSAKSGAQTSAQTGAQSGQQSTSQTAGWKIEKPEKDGEYTIAYFETNPDWKFRYSKEISEELIEAEMVIFSAFPPQIIRHIQGCSEGVTVKVIDKLPKDAAQRPEYSAAPAAPDMKLHFAHNTMFMSVEGSDKVIAHHLDGLEPEAEKKWDEKLKPESIKLYHRYQASLPKDGKVSTGDSISEFLKNNYLWIFLNCPNLCQILLDQ